MSGITTQLPSTGLSRFWLNSCSQIIHLYNHPPIAFFPTGSKKEAIYLLYTLHQHSKKWQNMCAQDSVLTGEFLFYNSTHLCSQDTVLLLEHWQWQRPRMSDPNALNVKLWFLYRDLDLSASDISSFLLMSNSVLLFLKQEKWSIQINRYSFFQSISWIGLCRASKIE